MRKAATRKMNIFEVPACNNTALRRAARRLGNLYDEALAPLGLKATQVGLLAEIARLTASNSEQPPTLQELASRLAIQLSALTHALRPLVRDGLVDVLADEADRRTKRGALSAIGEARLNEALVHWAEANERVEAVLGSGAAEMLRSLADHVASDEFLVEYAQAQPGKAA